MSFINYGSREINCKVVYYGPGLGGKTTNLKHMYSRTRSDVRGQLVSLATQSQRTLFFDFLPLALGEIQGLKTRFHLYTTPGQIFYTASRKLILQGVDGVVFVADSQPNRMDANLEALDDLRRNLEEHSYDPDTVPFVIQYNKRDSANAVPLAEMRRLLNPGGVCEFEATASVGQGVFPTFKGIAKRILVELNQGAFRAAASSPEPTQLSR